VCLLITTHQPLLHSASPTMCSSGLHEGHGSRFWLPSVMRYRSITNKNKKVGGVWGRVNSSARVAAVSQQPLHDHRASDAPQLQTAFLGRHDAAALGELCSLTHTHTHTLRVSATLSAWSKQIVTSASGALHQFVKHTRHVYSRPSGLVQFNSVYLYSPISQISLGVLYNLYT